ncbi:glycoside hydrolase family 18 protein, partial [Mucilaginibacter lappiensis]
YTYQIELRNTAAIPVPVALSATITNWTDVPSGSAVVEPDLTIKGPYKVAYYAFDHNGLPLSTFAPDANVVILFEGTIWAMADPQNYPFAENYIHTNRNYTSYEQIIQDIRVLQSKGVKVLYNVDDDPAWQNTIALPNGTRGWLGSDLNAQQYIVMVTNCVNVLHLDGIALDVEHFYDAPNDNFNSVVRGFGSHFGPSSNNPSSIYTAAIYSGTSSGYAIGQNKTLAGYMNFVMDMSYSSDYTDTFNLWAPSIGNNHTMVGMQKGYVDLPTAIAAAKWQPSGVKKAGIMVYAANDDPDYTSQVLKAAN